MNELVPSVSIDNLIAQRDAMVERLRKAAELLGEVEELSKAALGSDAAMPSLECRRSHAAFPCGIDELVKRVDAAAWDHLMSQSGMRTFMHAEAREKWDRDISERKVPPLTRENIASTFAGLYDSRRVMFERGVVDIFRKLSWDYKTNNPVRFGKRIILRYAIDVWGNGAGKYVSGPSHTGCNKLDDLMRVLLVLDGKPEPDHRRGAYALLHEQIGVGRELPKDPIELNGVLSARFFRNGNGHITFLREDLVDKLNQIIARHYPGALPPAAER